MKIMALKKDIFSIVKELKESKNDIENEINKVKELKRKAIDIISKRDHENIKEKENYANVKNEINEEKVKIEKNDDKHTFDNINDLLSKRKLEMLLFQPLFSCDQCHKMFTSVNECKMHMWTHAGAQSCTCIVCDKLFVCGGELKGHWKTEISWVYIKYCNQEDLKEGEISGRSFIAKRIENFIFHVF